MYIAYQLKNDSGADSIKKAPVFAGVRGYPESRDHKYNGVICNQAADYLTPVSCGGSALDKTNYMNLSSPGKGDTMETIGEYQTMYPIPEVMSALTCALVSVVQMCEGVFWTYRLMQ